MRKPKPKTGRCRWCLRRRPTGKLEPLVLDTGEGERQCKEYEKCNLVYMNLPASKRPGDPW